MKICMIQQHPVDEAKIPAAILRWVVIHDRLRERGHDLITIGPNDRFAFGERSFRGVRQLLVPTPGSGIKSLDMLFFALLLLPVMLKIRREIRPDSWFVDELFVAFGVALMRVLYPSEHIVYDVMGIHYYQVRKNNSSLLRHYLLAPMYGLLEHLTLWSASCVTTVNDAHRELLEQWTKRPVYVIRDAAEFSGEVPPAKLPSKDPDTIDLLFVGKISNRRLDDLYHVLPALMEELPGLRLLIVGDGPFHDFYLEKTRELGLEKRVHFAGFVPHAELPAWIGHGDISYSDDWSDIGFPMKVFEYMAMGAAILVEDTPAVREVMRHQENAMLYHGRAGLKSAVLNLARDGTLREAIGRQAALDAAREHGWEDRIDAFERLFAGKEPGQ
jgi:glycosyltransferase involved in cell wall biosynthesis